jgi:guanine deaminase
MTEHQQFINKAIHLSQQGMQNNEGGPSGCVIVNVRLVVGIGNKRALSTNDLTAHAEIVAIRDACKNLRTFQH